MIVTKTYSQLNLTGSRYDIGYKQGTYLHDHPQRLSYFTSGSFNRRKSVFSSPQEIVEFYDSHIPGFQEEIEGFLTGSQTSLEQLTCLDYPYSIENHCSHLALHPQLTDTGHTYLARTYDWHYNDEDLRHLYTKSTGMYGHLGFSTLLTGRTEGLNDQGLAVIMAGGGAWEYKLTMRKGINFSFAIRTILDRCRTTQQAVDILTDLPINTSTHYLIADKKRSYHRC